MRVAFLGVAHVHADAYAETLRAAGVEIVGAADRDAERASAWGRRHAVPVFDDPAALVAQADAVIVCSETAFHLESVLLAAEAGCDILCEKPLGRSMAESRRLVEACDERGVRLVTAFPARFDPTMRRTKDLVANGSLGVVRAITGVNQSVMPLRDRAWFADPALAGGGAMMDHIVHLADLCTWMLGAEPESVYAVANRVMHSTVVSVETSGLVMLGYPGGVFASIDCSWNRPLDYPTWGGLAMSVVADGGRVDAELGVQRLERFGGATPYSWIPWGIDSNERMLRDFLSPSVDAEAASGADGLSATRVALAALESARTGEVVALGTEPADG